jgi:hypothetical protein
MTKKELEAIVIKLKKQVNQKNKSQFSLVEILEMFLEEYKKVDFDKLSEKGVAILELVEVIKIAIPRIKGS